MNSELVSIIVPCYKQAHLLPDTIASVLAQTYTNWECIIVNDGSPDNTEEVASIISQKDQRIKVLNQSNQGLAMARNNGIHISTGEYILPLDSDDLIAPTYIEKALKRFRDYPNTKLVYSKADRFDQKHEYWNLPEYKYDEEIWGNQIFCSAIFKRVDYDKTIGYNPNMKGGYEDWDFWLSLLSPNDVVYRIDEVLFHYRFQKKSMTEEAHKKMNFLFRQIYLNHEDIYKEYCQDIIVLRNKALSFEKISNVKLIQVLLNIRTTLKNIKNKI